MTTTKVICNRCGKEIKGCGYVSNVKMSLLYWHGGSMGGSEDEDKFDFDLCDDCACALSYKIRRWLKNEEI